MSHSGYVHVEVEEILRETERAFLVRFDGEETWLPKACIADADCYDAGDVNVTISVREGIAREKGLAE